MLNLKMKTTLNCIPLRQNIELPSIVIFTSNRKNIAIKSTKQILLNTANIMLWESFTVLSSHALGLYSMTHFLRKIMSKYDRRRDQARVPHPFLSVHRLCKTNLYTKYLVGINYSSFHISLFNLVLRGVKGLLTLKIIYKLNMCVT